MPLYETRRDLANKVDWEGGIEQFIFDYGVQLEDLPDGDSELRELVEKIQVAEPAIRRLEELLEEAQEDEDD